MDRIDEAYWQGKQPKTTEELQHEIRLAVQAAEEWLGAAQIDPDDSTMVYAQIYWLKQLLGLARIELDS